MTYYSTVIVAKRAARDLRRKQTNAEAKLWNLLRNRQFYGKKFLRQHPIFFEYESKKRFFIADFYCHEEKLVVEIDGKIHEYQKDYDNLRTYIINAFGIRVARFRNEEVENNIETVSDALRRLITK